MMRLRWLVLLLTLGMLSVIQAAQPSLEAYQARLPGLRAQIPELTFSSDWCADNNLTNPGALVVMPYQPQASFTEELISRAGGLAAAWIIDDNRKTAQHDVVLLSVRSWEAERNDAIQKILEYKHRGWIVTVFASAAGKPEGLPIDFFIDNGAPAPGREYGPTNLLANVTLGWMWCCEYAAAMSRQGKFPAILYSVAMPGAEDYNKALQKPEGRTTILPCDRKIPEGKLAEQYLQRVEKLVADCRSERIQGQLAQAADGVAARMKKGEAVGLSGVGHVILYEIKLDLQAPWKPFDAAGKAKTAFSQNLAPGQLLVWIGYAGMNSAYEDFAGGIANAFADLISCYAFDPIWAKDAPAGLGHIDQCWELPDAEVPIPIFPNKMAPVSGINQGLILRMLDDEVARRLVERQQ